MGERPAPLHNPVAGTPGEAEEQVLSPSLTTNCENLPLEPSVGWPSMEAATALQVASGPTLKVKEVSPGNAEEPQTSPREGAGSPIPQLLSPVEGDLWGWGVWGAGWGELGG